MSPFRLVRDSSSGCFIIRTWRPQQVICAVLNILSLFRLMASVRSSFPENKSILRTNPTPYFYISLGICGLLYKLVTLKRFWFHKEKYQKVLNVLISESYLSNRKTKITNPYFICAVFGLSTLQGAACLIGGYSFVDPIFTWTPSWWFRRLIAFGKYAICFGEPLKPNVAPALSQITAWDGIVALLMFLSEYERIVVGFFSDQCILASALTLWTAGSSFSQNVEDSLRDCDYDKENGKLQNLRDEWKSLYKSFQGIQKLSGVINSALGSQVTWIIVGIFYGFTCCIVCISADICKKMASIKLWMVKEDNMKAIPPEEANVVLHEIIVKDIGIRGNNVFTLTYPLVSTFLSLVLTFFVICIQQNES